MYKKIALLGGAFNPPTIGHVQTAYYVLNSTNIFNEVHLLPCFSHMFGKTVESDTHRIKMCELIAVDSRIKVNPYEVENKIVGGTYHVIKRLLQDGYNVSFIMGADNVHTFDKWSEYQNLERLVQFVIVPRIGAFLPQETDWYLKPPHIYLVGNNPPEKVSSTEVRVILKGLKNRPIVMPQSLNKFLDPVVYGYIREHKLYQD
jgi:nicotinate-nucleotide adenylyltransferase